MSTATRTASAAAVCQMCHDDIFSSVFLLSLRNLAARLRLHTLSFVRWRSHTADEYSTCGLSRLYTLAPVSLQVSGLFLPKLPFQGSAEERGIRCRQNKPCKYIIQNCFLQNQRYVTSVTEVKGSEAKIIRVNIKIYFSYQYSVIHCHLIFWCYQLIILIAGPACSTK